MQETKLEVGAIFEGKVTGITKFGAVVDIMIAALLSGLTDLITFKDFLGIIISTVSVMSIYSALVILYCVLLGYGKEMYTQLLSIATMLLAVILLNLNTIKETIVTISSAEGSDDISFIWRMLDFIKGKAYMFLFAAILTSIVSYILAVFTAERKRGVI